MRILVTNVYSYKNKGDAAIVLALVQEIRRVFDSPEILIQTADARHDRDKYGAPVTSSLLWILLSKLRTRSLPVRLMVPIGGICGLGLYFLSFRLFGRGPDFLLSKDLQQFVRENRETDLAIACGGGYLRTANSGMRETILLGVTCCNILTAKYTGKKIFLYSQSIGPMHSRLQAAMLRFTLNRVDAIEPREDVSYRYVQRLGVHSKVIETADPALLLGGSGKFPTEVVKLRPRRLHVGLTVRKWFDAPEALENYLRAVAQTLDYLIEKHDAEIFYVPQVIAENFGDDDREIAHRVWEHVKNQQYFTVVEADLHPFEIIGLCGRMDIFIGTRMHSNIFALICGVPVVAIEYEHKTKGIMRGLGLEDLTIDIRNVTFTALKQKVDRLLENQTHYKKLITQNLPDQIDKSKRAIEVVKKIYETET